MDNKIDGKIQGELKIYKDPLQKDQSILMGFKGHMILDGVSEKDVEELKKKVADPRCDPEKDLNDQEKQILTDLLDGIDPKRGAGYFYAPYSPLLTTPAVLDAPSKTEETSAKNQQESIDQESIDQENLGSENED